MYKRVALALLFLPGIALAQEVPSAAAKDMWCGTAFLVMTGNPPPDATPQKLAEANVYAEGGQRLIDRAIPIYLESGYTDEALGAYRDKLEAGIGRSIGGVGGDDPRYSFQDCSALIGQ